MKAKTDKELTARTAVDRRKPTERRASVERRTEGERRTKERAVTVERRGGRERRAEAKDGERRKVERRINEYVLEPQVLEFINAINEFKSVQQKPFPTWSDILQVLLSLGYRKPD